MTHEADGLTSVSRAGLVPCDKGQHLWIEATSGDSFKSKLHETSFSGILLYATP